MKKTFLFSAIIIFIYSCTLNRPVKNQHLGQALGTTYSITVIADEELNLQRQIDSVFSVINQSMSTYIADSDISKINKGDSTIVVDHMFKDVFEISSKVFKSSNGYFDPTVGVLVNAWGFGPENQMKLDSTKVDSLLQFVGWNKVQLNENATITKQNPDIRFDFNAVAKGYAIDRLGVMLDKKGIKNYLVEVGGEVLAKGSNTIKEKLWSVGVDDPTNLDERGLGAVIALKDKAMASSGNYRKFRIDPKTGEKYVHTVNPKTGFTKNSKVLAATIIADSCASADAYATAFMAMDLSESIKLLERHKELDAFVIYIDDEGAPQRFMTKGFEQMLKN